jgi:hypothetical protein
MTNQRPRAQCGTTGGYDSHRYHNEDPCERCKRANREYQREWRQRNRPTRAVPPDPKTMFPTQRIPVAEKPTPCQVQNKDLWLAEEPDSVAAQWCQSCPLIKPCLAYALGWKLFGVWGGLTMDERKAIQKEQGIKAKPVLSGWRAS